MTSNAVLTKLDDLQTTVEVLTRGLNLLAETLGTHSEMLSQILQACSMEPPESDLTETLERIADAVEAQTETLVAISKTLDRLDLASEE